MFRISFFVDDKHLADVLRGIAGKARGAPEVVPVVNAVQDKANGKLRQDSEHTLGLFLKELKKIAPEKPTSADARTALSACGLSPTSNNYFLKAAIKAGLMKKGKPPGTGRPQTWDWV